jgi:large subunit ribosomal protein L24
MKLRKNDVVMVISGTQKGKSGKILEVDRDAGRVLVEGVNFIWKHLRRSQQHPHGARIQKEAPIHASNVMLVCPSCSKPSKIGFKRLEDGERARICKKCRQAVASEA